MKTMKRAGVGFACLLLLLFTLLGCQTTGESSGDDQTATGATGEGMDCEIAVMFLFDVSGSMGARIDPSDANSPSILDALKDAAIGVVNAIPSDRWEVGLFTFERPGGPDPIWGMERLIATNRPVLVAALESLTAAGASDLSSAVVWSYFHLSDYDVPKFIVIFSDGGVCSASPVGGGLSDDCTNTITEVNYLKDEGVRFLTVGYGLVDESAQVMEAIAHPDPYHNIDPATSIDPAAEIVDYFQTVFEDICDFLMLQMDARVPDELAPGGSATGQSQVIHLQGDDRDVVLEGSGSFVDAGGDILFSPDQDRIGAANTPRRQKVELKASLSMAPGDYTAYLSVHPSGGGQALAYNSAPVEVLDFDLSVEFVGTPTWSQPDLFTGRIKINSSSNVATQASISYIVVPAGGYVSLSEFVLEPTVASRLPIPASQNASQELPFAIKRTAPVSGTTELHVIVVAEGKVAEIVTTM